MIPLIRIGTALVLALTLGVGEASAFGGGGASSSKENSDYREARKLVEAGNYAAAVPLLEKVVSAEPKNADAYNYLGYSQRKLGNRQAALDGYAKALAIDPEHRGANEYLGELYLDMGDLGKARERLEVLDGACFFGCAEYRELKAAIEDYIARGGG